jgi:hypothetical protein
MGHDTSYIRRIEVTPPLNAGELAYLRQFAAATHEYNPDGPYALRPARAGYGRPAFGSHLHRVVHGVLHGMLHGALHAVLCTARGRVLEALFWIGVLAGLPGRRRPSPPSATRGPRLPPRRPGRDPACRRTSCCCGAPG